MPSKPGHSCRVKFRRTHQQIDNVPRDLAALGRCNTHVTIAYFNYATVTYCGRLHRLPSRGSQQPILAISRAAYSWARCLVGADSLSPKRMRSANANRSKRDGFLPVREYNLRAG
jgi:hypothetical protein